MFKIYIYLLFVTAKMWLETTNEKFVYSGNIFPKMPIMKQCQKTPQKIAKIKTFVTLQYKETFNFKGLHIRGIRIFTI